MGLRKNLEAMLARGQETALLRFTLGTQCLKSAEHEDAARHLRRAVELDPDHTAAWKELGRTLALLGDHAGALDAWQRGRALAEKKGDIQAGKEMAVFMRRLMKTGQNQDN